MAWAKQLGYNDFKASPCWINKTLQRNNLTRVNLHGEANEMSEEEFKAVMGPWKKKFHDLCEKKKVNPSCVYNADQTGIFSKIA